MGTRVNPWPERDLPPLDGRGAAAPVWGSRSRRSDGRVSSRVGVDPPGVPWAREGVPSSRHRAGLPPLPAGGLRRVDDHPAGPSNHPPGWGARSASGYRHRGGARSSAGRADPGAPLRIRRRRWDLRSICGYRGSDPGHHALAGHGALFRSGVSSAPSGPGGGADLPMGRAPLPVPLHDGRSGVFACSSLALTHRLFGCRSPRHPPLPGAVRKAGFFPTHRGERSSDAAAASTSHSTRPGPGRTPWAGRRRGSGGS